MRTCSRCKIVKSDSCFMFRADRPTQLRSWCTDCYVDYNKSYRHSNPIQQERSRDRTKKWVKDNPDKARSGWLLKKFGITLGQKLEMLAEQGNKCGNPRCEATSPGFYRSKDRQGKPRDWHVDHDHKTLLIRGVLCPGCNMALGQIQDNVERLKGLIEYLEKHQSISAVAGLLQEREDGS